MSNENIDNVRERAVEWFNNLNLQEQFDKTIEYNHLIEGDNTKHPDTLSIREVHDIYTKVHSL